MKQAAKKKTAHTPLRRRVLIAAAALLVVAALGVGAYLLFSGQDDLNTVVADTVELYRDTQTGAVYRILPNSYEPMARGEEYARLDMDGVEFVLHRIAGLSPERFLCSTYNDVYCPEDYEPTPFADMEISVLHVCTNTNLIVDALTIKPSVLQSSEHCALLYALLQEAYQSAPAVSYPSWAEVESAYTLRFESDDIPGLYFSVKMIRYAEDIYDGEVNLGRVFLYDRYAAHCVPLPDTIFRMLDGATLAEALGLAEESDS